MMPRFSANLGFLWPDRPLPDRIAAAAEAGFRAVELHWPYELPPESLRHACARHGVTLLGLNTAAGGPGDFGLAALPGREAEFIRSMDQAVAYARSAGASAVHVMAGVLPMGQHVQGRATLARNLAYAVATAPDLTLLLEPINQRDRPGYFYSTLAEALSLIKEAAAPNLKLMFDTYHVGVTEGDILTRLETHLPHIGHVQIAAVPSRAEPDEGEIHYPAIFAALDRLGYAGWVGCEYKPRGDTDAGLAWVPALGMTL
jgi:hydroxypyruvate isomerase